MRVMFYHLVLVVLAVVVVELEMPYTVLDVIVAVVNNHRAMMPRLVSALTEQLLP